jgi:hypothetical protein
LSPEDGFLQVVLGKRFAKVTDNQSQSMTNLLGIHRHQLKKQRFFRNEVSVILG